MGFVDHLKGKDTSGLYLEAAFGKHVIEGDLAKSIVTGASPTHVVNIQVMLGEAFGKKWKGPTGVWYAGTNRPSSKYTFHPGKQSTGNSDSEQGIDSIFTNDHPHSNAAWIRVECPNGSEVGIPDFDTMNNPPDKFSGIFECQLGDIYDASGNVVSSDQYLTNAADVITFGLKEIMRAANSRIDFPSLAALRTAANASVTPDYRTLPKGVGLTAKYFSGTNFDTLIESRVDPTLDFIASAGSPALGVPVDNFSARYEGWIKPKYSETYTFYLIADDGGRLWVNGTLIVDSWSAAGEHSGTIALTAEQFYDIKVEWKDAAGNAELRLDWSSTTLARQIVPQARLYPKNEATKRFETHVAFTSPANIDEFLRSVLFTCNGGYQDADGKLKFFIISDLTSSFTFNEQNIVKNSFKIYPRFSQEELRNLPNRFVAEGRDLDSRYLERFDPPCYYDVPWLQEIAGRVIEETVAVGNGRRPQVIDNLAHYAKLRTGRTYCEFDGLPITYPVLPGDVVTVNHAHYGLSGAQFLAVETTDKSFDKAPDERFFKLLSW